MTSNKSLVATLVFYPWRQEHVEMETRNIFYAAEILGSIWYQKAKVEISKLKIQNSWLCLLVPNGP